MEQGHRPHAGALVDPNDEFLVYSFGTDYRAPFAQALLNLFVDTSERGVDNYPDRSLARNPWINFVRYEDEVSAQLDQLGRENFFQPDAGAGAGTVPALEPVQQLRPAQSVSAVERGARAAGRRAGRRGRAAIPARQRLGRGLDGRWAWPTPPSGPPAPRTPRACRRSPTTGTWRCRRWRCWNSSTATESRASQFFANLPEVKAALDTVFLDGDLNGNGVTNAADLAIWRTGFGAAVNASPAAGDADGDGDVDGDDFLRWQRGFGGTTLAAAAVQSVPEPASIALAAIGLMTRLLLRRPSRDRRIKSLGKIVEQN